MSELNEFTRSSSLPSVNKHYMNDPSTNNFHAVVNQVNKFDGKRAGDVLE